MTHCELVLIHPFREGNGRCARILAILMAVPAGLPVLDFEPMEANTDAYITAIQASMASDYGPMTAISDRVITRTIEQVEG